MTEEMYPSEMFEEMLSEYPHVFDDPVPFKVLLLVANKVDNPKSIADALGIKPPSVMYQLRRLRKVALVELGEKMGKIQHYEVNWDGVGRAFLRAIGCSEYFDEVSANPYFKKVLREAFNAAGEFAVKCRDEVRRVRLKKWNTSLFSFFSEFRTALVKSFPECDKANVKDRDLKRFIVFLEKCYEKFMRFYGTKGDLFWRIAFEKGKILEAKFSR